MSISRILGLIVLVIVLAAFTGCELVGGIFKTGMIWGIFLVVIIVAAIIYLITKGRR